MSRALSSSSTHVATPLPYTFQQVVTEGTDRVIYLLQYQGVRVRWMGLDGENPELAEHLYEVEEESRLQPRASKRPVDRAWRVEPYTPPPRSPTQRTSARAWRLELLEIMQNSLDDETWKPILTPAESSP